MKKGDVTICAANRNHKYRRVVEDWIEVCRPCHSAYDKAKGLRHVARVAA